MFGHRPVIGCHRPDRAFHFHPNAGRAEDTPSIADDAVTIGAKALWLQTGIVSEDAAARAEKGGLTVVMDACIGATHSLLRVPRKTPG